MSLPEMQTALAMVVRYPLAFQGTELEALLDQFTLTENERRSVAAIAGDRELGKFGYGLQDMRWSLIEARLPLVKRLVDSQLLFTIFQELFDPESTDIPNSDLALSFLCFLEENEAARNRLGEAPACLADFITFEKVQLEIERDRWLGLPSPATHSPLATFAFYPRKFSHDLAGFLQAIDAGELAAEPVAGETYALLLGTEALPGYRLFELDRETFDYLQAALDGREATRPASFEDLVAAGLCKPEASHAA